MRCLKTILFLLPLLNYAAIHAQSADDIMQQHIQAMGGPGYWDKTKNIKLQGHIYQQGVEIDLTNILCSKGGYTSNTYSGYTNQWVIIPQGSWSAIHEVDSVKVDTITAYNAIFYHPYSDLVSSLLLNYKSKGMTAQLSGMDTIKNAACHKIVLTDAKGDKLTAFFDAKTYYLLRIEGTQQTDDGDKDLFTTYDKYEKHGDIIVPMTCVNQNTGNAHIKETVFTTAEVNVQVDESLFELKHNKKK